MNSAEALNELKERTGRLLPSQNAFLSSPETQTCIAGGWASGKTHIACVKGLLLSAIFPGNHGFIGRYHSSDLEDSTIPSFFSVCPPSWIRHYYKQKGHEKVVLKNGSDIVFRHLHDAGSSTKSRRVGANFGWVMIDQLEECLIDHWNTMLGRIRQTGIPKHFIFATMNPAGHDDFYRYFFEGIETQLSNLPPGKFFATKHGHDRLGIAVNSLENRESNGGFVADDYFDNLLTSMEQAWIDRYVYCSFDDFAGKIYREYHLDSVHNIKRFAIPAHWPTYVGIDVGGDHPWALGVARIDDAGNVIWTEGLLRSNMNSLAVATWVKEHADWKSNNTINVIDYENRLAMIELGENDIHCQPAVKKVLPGITRMMGYIHIRPDKPLPYWYKDTQGEMLYNQFKIGGAPSTYIFDDLLEPRKQWDGYLWDLNKVNTPLKIKDDFCDMARYVYFKRPMAGKLPAADKFAALRIKDPMAAREWEAYDRRVQARMDRKSGRTSLHEMEAEAVSDRYSVRPGKNGNLEWE